ncbi:hypothetical protein Bca52824_074020 [Brassica carinata]|uniref:Uncharacterized protein n=1 Tax=Brassica carinata TaxID=52824 RepID=A0A8X7U7A6_BRACI|nr:hypothetical protein Bca52824_074020 [Brassica carinata]
MVLLAKPGKEDGNKSLDKRAVRFYMKENLIDAQLTFKEEMMARACLALSKEMEDSERGGNLAKTTMVSFENHSISISTYEAFQSPRPPELSLFIVRFRHWMSKKLEVGVVEKKTRATLSSSDKTWSEVYGAFSSIRSWRTWCRNRIEDQFLFSRADIFITEMALLIKVAGAVLQGLRYLILAEVQVQCGGIDPNRKTIKKLILEVCVNLTVAVSRQEPQMLLLSQDNDTRGEDLEPAGGRLYLLDCSFNVSFIILLSHEEHCTKYEATLSELWFRFMSIWVLNKFVFNKLFGTRSRKVKPCIRDLGMSLLGNK